MTGLSRLPRLRVCGRRMAGDEVAVKYDAASGVAHLAGVQTCGNAWCCPVCAPKVRQLKADEVEQGLLRHHAAGGTAAFVTFTMRHVSTDKLKWLLLALQKALRDLRSGRTYQSWKAQYGIVGVIVAREITHGENGWHPHAHTVWLFDRQLTAQELQALEDDVRMAWHTLIRRATGRRLTKAAGVDWRQVTVDRGLSGYLVKVSKSGLGGELVRGDFKTGRSGSSTPAELLAEVLATGDVAPLELWHEYEAATRRLPVLTWSKGLRARLGLTAVELTDEELAAAEVEGQSVLTLDPTWWRALLDRRMVVPLLEAVERAGGRPRPAVMRWLFWSEAGGDRPPD